MLSVGIDFGTSNSSVAAYDGSNVRLLDIDPFAPDKRVMKSLLYLQRTGDIAYGRQALDLYLEQNTGRAVQYESKRVGEVTMVFADIGTMIKDVYADIDVNEPGRLFQSLKRFLSVSAFRVTNVFGLHYGVEELLSLLARRLLTATVDAIGRQPDVLVIGRPVRFSEDPAANDIAIERLREAWRLAGAPEVRFVEEPVGAIHHFASQNEMRRTEHVVVFDFGGGTLDVCIARVDGAAVEVLATDGVALGGDLLDGRIVETQLTPFFGDGSHSRLTGLPMPRFLFNRLRSWQTLYELNRPQQMSLIRDLKHESDRPERIERLETLVSRNYGLAFFQSVERAKIALSNADEAMIELVTDDFNLRQTLRLSALEATIAPQVRQAEKCVSAALELASVDPGDVGLVLTTGGSSLIPAFRRMLQHSLPNARLQASDAFTSVASGLAMVDAT